MVLTTAIAGENLLCNIFLKVNQLRLFLKILYSTNLKMQIINTLSDPIQLFFHQYLAEIYFVMCASLLSLFAVMALFANSDGKRL